jgi:DNA-binding Lrp family transcriptional regulator
MKDENYYQVSGWMRNKLNLKGVELLCYAIIYGFTQDGNPNHLFRGSLNYLEDMTGSSRSTLRRALQNLVDQGLIRKEVVSVNEVTFNHYSCFDQGGVKMIRGGCQNDAGGGVKMTPYNNIIDNNIDNNISPLEKNSNLFPELDKNRKTLFRNSPLNDFKIFEKKFQEPEWAGVDLAFYYHSVRDWSDSSDTKRNAMGWVATARSFMRKDHGAKKLRMIGKKEKDLEDFMEMERIFRDGIN